MPVLKEIPISLNYAITDVREPDKAKTSFSKTVQIPMNKTSNQFFEFVFECNVLLNAFNPGIKTPAKFLENEKVAFSGDLQLLSITKAFDGTTTGGVYECSIVGVQGGLFLDIGDALLEDIDFSDLNHTLTYPYSGFTPAVIGTGYACGFSDYGFGDTTNQTWKFENLKPGIFEREVLSRIFANAGYTWNSQFLDSTYYKHRIIPCTNEGKLKQSATDIADSQFYAGKTASSVNIYTITGQFIPFPNNTYYQPVLTPGWYYGTYTPPFGGALNNLGTLTYNDESTAPFFDTGGVYTSNIFTPSLTSIYQICSANDIGITVNPPAGTAAVFSSTLVVTILTNIDWSPDGVNWYNITQTSSSVSIPNFGAQIATYAITPPTLLTAGYQYRAYAQCYCTGVMLFEDAGAALITTGTTTLTFTHDDTSTFYAKVVNDQIQYGDTIDMNQIMPKNVKQRDLLKSIIQSYNLRLERNRYNPLQYDIEPHEDFYNSTNDAIDYTQKLDTSKDIEVIPMGELDAKTYLFTYKSDVDVFNDRYTTEFKEVYGQEYIEVTNDFIQPEKKVELIFSATPIVSNNYNNIICPKFYKEENGIAKNTKCNIRVLYWGGAKPTNLYFLEVNGSTNVMTTYYYWGHVDDPIAPTLDLSFDNPLRIYWTLPAQNYTNNDLYGAYWSRFIEEITDKDSKIIRAYFNMNEIDISTFSFRNLIYADLGGGGAYYYVNKIIDYNPLVKKTTQLELLKVKYADAFQPEIIISEVGTSGTGAGALSGNLYKFSAGFSAPSYSPNFNGNGSLTVGANNLTKGTYTLVVGEDNIVNE
jgi:hypothetical protein